MHHCICYLCAVFVLCFGLQALKAENPLEWMIRHTGMTEIPLGSNRGPVIDQANELCGVPMGSPWCASIISLAYHETGHEQPRTAWSPAMFPKDKRVPVKTIRPGDIGGIYYSKLYRIGHVLMLQKKYGQIALTVEGNTNKQGSREGDQLAKRKRPISQIRLWARWEVK